MSKIDRNVICPLCNSGKKYKKCCLLKEQEAKQKEIDDWNKWFEEDCKLGQMLLQKQSEKINISTGDIT
jgi:hypothetical protein